MDGKALTVPLVVLVASGIGSAAVAPLAPTRLLVEYAASPATVDSEHPRFSWHNSVAEVAPSDITHVNITAVGGGRRVVQWAFRVQVCEVPLQRSTPWSGTTWECDSECASGSCMWDSGKVSNATKSWNIILAGTTPLLSDRTYAWRVMWWARRGGEPGEDAVASPFSEVATFNTGLIGMATALPDGAMWIGASLEQFNASRLGTTQVR
jgi:hypothetical protein